MKPYQSAQVTGIDVVQIQRIPTPMLYVQGFTQKLSSNIYISILILTVYPTVHGLSNGLTASGQRPNCRYDLTNTAHTSSPIGLQMAPATTTSPRTTPVSVQSLSSVSQISAGDGYTCAVIANGGTVQCWGWNGFGQLCGDCPWIYV